MNNKLLIVGSFPDDRSNIFGGIAKSCRILVNSNHFNEFKILKLDSSQASSPKPSLLVRFFYAISRILRLIYLNYAKKPEVVLIFCSDGFSAIEKGIMIIISKFQGSKVMIFPRAGKLIEQANKNGNFNYLIKRLFSKSDIFLAQGKNWKKFAEESLNIVSDKIEIVHNWTATKELLNIGFNKKIVDKTNIKLLYIGWLEKEKGLRELINATKLLTEKEYSLELILIGDGSMRKQIEEYIIKNNIENYVSIKGWLKSNKIKYYLEDSDIFVLPSWQEGMPNALIEAISAGLPTIATPVGVIPNYLTHNESTILVEPNNIINLEKSIEKLINDVNLRKKISKNGLLIAKKFFEAEKSIKKLSAIIKNVI